MVRFLFLFLMLPHMVSALQFTHQLTAAALPSGELQVISAADLTFEVSPEISASVSASTEGEGFPLPWEFRFLSVSFSKPLVSTLSHELSASLHLSWHSGSRVHIRTTLEGSYNTPPVSHLFSGSFTLAPPWGASYQATASMLHAVTSEVGFSVFAAMEGAMNKPLMSGTPGTVSSTLRTGFRSSFIHDQVSHHISLSILFFSYEIRREVRYLFVRSW